MESTKTQTLMEQIRELLGLYLSEDEFDLTIIAKEIVSITKAAK